MATGKLFRIICYLKTMRLFSNSREQRGGFSSLHLKPIRCVADVLHIQSEACEIFSGSPHAVTLHQSPTADARLFQFQPTGCFIDSGFLFIALDIDVSLLLSRV